MYVTWAEKRLDRIAKGHLSEFFKQTTSLEEYYSILHKLRVTPQILQDIRLQLELIFPFMQRMTNPQKIVLQYINMIETLHDSLQEEEIISIPKRNKTYETATDDETELLSDEPATQEDTTAEHTPSKVIVAETQAITETLQDTTYIEQVQAVDETVVQDTTDTEQDQAVEDVMDIEQDQAVADTENQMVEEMSQNPITAQVQTESIDQMSAPVLTDRARCKALGIILKGQKNCKQLLEQYENGTIATDNLTKKALISLLQKMRVNASFSKMSREQLIELYKETNGNEKN